MLMPALLPHIAAGAAPLIATRPNRDYGAVLMLMLLLSAANSDMLPTLLAAKILVILLVCADC